MKANLMFKNRDFILGEVKYFGRELLITDLQLKRILDSMAQGDETIRNACTTALFCPLLDLDEIKFRQDNMADVRANAAAARALYGVIDSAKRQKSTEFRAFSTSDVRDVYSNAINYLRTFIASLIALKGIADKESRSFKSEGFTRFFSMLRDELSHNYLKEVQERLSELNAMSDEGTSISASLGPFMQGIDYKNTREDRHAKHKWRTAGSYSVSDRSKTSHQELDDLKRRQEKALNDVTLALSQAARYLDAFFTMLRSELAFYVGSLNLEESLKSKGLPVCIPTLRPLGSYSRTARQLYDVSLAFTNTKTVVGNEMNFDDIRLYVITGANQGGKSTFLRSVGQAQLMAQCGMLVGAEEFTAPLRRGVFTHFKKEEDSSMRSGKLDEELERMGNVADSIKAGALVMLNESFASTNEREGSEICRQITQAFVENGIEVLSVTHLYMYSTAFENAPKTKFLRAERLEDGQRTFRIIAGEPLQTAFGTDLYDRIFGVVK